MKLDNTKNYFVTAIGTDSGKTFVCSYLCEKFGFDYWKPIQSGPPRDTETVQKSLTRTDTQFFPEQYVLKTPMSPHEAANIDDVTINLDNFQVPHSDKGIIIEGAGGVMVPLNDTETITDLILKLEIPVIIVVNFYLGSINHTLLTIEYLKQKNVTIEGIIYNGTPTPSSIDIINKIGKIPVLGHIPQANNK